MTRSGHKKQQLFHLKSQAKEWEVSQKALPLEKFFEETPTEYSLAQWSTEYLDHAKSKYVDKTYAEKNLAFKRFFLSVKPTLPPSCLHPGIILKHFNKEVRERSGNAANKDRKNLIAAWNWAIRYIPGWPRDNPFVLTERQLETQFPRYIPPVEDFWKVYDTARDGQDKIMLLAYLHTAARKSELLTLKWSDVDLGGRRIRLWTRKRKGGLEQDWIPMTDELHDALGWWSEHRTFPEHDHVFVCEDQYNLARDFYGQAFSARVHWLGTLCERAKVEPFGFHAIRHLSASILDDAGYPITVIQALLRHRSATTTAKYLHNLRGLRAAFGDAFKRKGQPVEITPVPSGERQSQPALRLVGLGKAPKKAPEAHEPKKRKLYVVDFTA